MEDSESAHNGTHIAMTRSVRLTRQGMNSTSNSAVMQTLKSTLHQDLDSELYRIPIPSKFVRKHGLQCPWSYAQIVSLLPTLFNIASFAIVDVPICLSLNGNFVGTLFIILELASYTMVLSLGVYVSLKDPTDNSFIGKVRRVYSNFSAKNRLIDSTPSAKQFYCERCEQYVSEGSKHCFRCNRCTMNFDHHCIWLNNCIGSNNYSAFFVLLIILSFSALRQVAMQTFFYEVVLGDNILFQRIQANFDQMYEIKPDLYQLQASCLANLIMNGILFLPVTYLLGYHIFLWKYNLTTYQHIMLRRRKSPSKFGPKGNRIDRKLSVMKKRQKRNLTEDEDDEFFRTQDHNQNTVQDETKSSQADALQKQDQKSTNSPDHLIENHSGKLGLSHEYIRSQQLMPNKRLSHNDPTRQQSLNETESVNSEERRSLPRKLSRSMNQNKPLRINEDVLVSTQNDGEYLVLKMETIQHQESTIKPQETHQTMLSKTQSYIMHGNSQLMYADENQLKLIEGIVSEDMDGEDYLDEESDDPYDDIKTIQTNQSGKTNGSLMQRFKQRFFTQLFDPLASSPKRVGRRMLGSNRHLNHSGVYSNRNRAMPSSFNSAKEILSPKRPLLNN